MIGFQSINLFCAVAVAVAITVNELNATLPAK